MNEHNYYQNPIFPGLSDDSVLKDIIPSYDVNASDDNTSALKDIININKKKKGKFYIKGNDKDNYIEGILEDKGEDYLIISSPSTGLWNILPLNNLYYISFDEKINFNNN